MNSNTTTETAATAHDLTIELQACEAELSVTKGRLYANQPGSAEAFGSLERKRAILEARLDVAREREKASEDRAAAQRKAAMEDEAEQLEEEVGVDAQLAFGTEIGKALIPILLDAPLQRVDQIDEKCVDAQKKLRRLLELERELGLPARVQIPGWSIREVIRTAVRVVDEERRARAGKYTTIESARASCGEALLEIPVAAHFAGGNRQ